MVRIMTDSAADFSLQEAQLSDVIIAPLPITFENKVYLQERDPGFQEFYRLLQSSANMPFTSQAAPMDYITSFEAARDSGDELVVITLSGELSSTHQTAHNIKSEIGYDGIYVIDGNTAVMGQRILVEEALKLREAGKSGKEIYEAISALRQRVRVYGMIDTLEYLKMGGRIAKSAAFIGTLMHVKPMIEVRDGKVHVTGKARGTNAGIKLFFNMIDQGPQIDRDYPVYFGYANTSNNCHKFRAQAQARYDLGECETFPVGGVIGTHIGPGATAIAFIEKA